MRVAQATPPAPASMQASRLRYAPEEVPLRLMFPRVFELKICTNQEIGCSVMRNGVCMSGFFSTLGPTNLENCHAHAREKDCTGLCSQAAGSDSRRTSRFAVHGGERGDERTLAQFVATCACADESKQSEGGAQAGGSADGQSPHCSGSPSRRRSAAAHVVSGRPATGESRWTGRKSLPAEYSWNCGRSLHAQAWDAG
jgi:hypothetical protein